MLSASTGADLSRHIGWSRVGSPPDAIAWCAVLVGFVVAVTFPRFVATPRARRIAVAVAAASAAALSAGYVARFLRGGPRIIDATTYLLEARAIASGQLAWSPAEPGASVVGRFLVRDTLGDGSHVASIFPPGYPAFLAAFVKCGAPMASGPVLAALIVVATAWLAHEVAARGGAGAPPRTAAESSLLPVAAAGLSAVCAALRYHTADTMSHGLAALCATVALAATLRAARRGGDEGGGPSPRAAHAVVNDSLIGLSLGVLVATRPVTAVAIALVSGLILATSELGPPRHRARVLGSIALGAAPGIALFVLHQRAATGAWLASSQSLYYALSDAPAGCFRYGFGVGIGCEHEHGTFVAANLPERYGAFEAAATTLRRLKAHLVDPLSSEPAFLLVALGFASTWRGPRALRILALAPIALLVAYAPFYFDGNYPAGGARFVADTLPVEHVLAVVGAFAIARRFPLTRLTSPPRVAGLAIGLSLAGFAFRASYDHLLLRDREGGRPMFEPSVLAAAGVERGLVFVDTDHGFAIGHDPAARASGQVEVVRRHGDSLDRIAWLARGRPPAFAYGLSTLADGHHAEATVFAYEPQPVGRIEGEHLWPAIPREGASAIPRSAGGCASGGAWLAIHAPSGSGAVDFVLPRALEGVKLTPRVARAEGVAIEVTHTGGPSMILSGSAPPANAADAWRCIELASLQLHGADGEAPVLRIRVVGAPPASARSVLAALDVLILDGSPY